MAERPLKRAAFLTSIDQEVDAFIMVALEQPNFKLEGIEWADWEPPADEPKTRTPPLELDDYQEMWSGLEGPLIRVKCEECGCEKDAWVGDDGYLVDGRDRYCKHPDGDVFKTRPVNDPS